MPYSSQKLTSVAECDLVLGTANKEKNDFSYRKLSLERKQERYAENVVELQSELQTVNAEAAALDAVIASLPEGDIKDENVTRRKRLELKQFLLNEKKDNFGSIALLHNEHDLALVIKQIEEIDAFIASIAARKAVLSAA